MRNVVYKVFLTKNGEKWVFKDNSFNSRDARRPETRRMLFGVSVSLIHVLTAHLPPVRTY
jgi:hypothetical protein